MAMKACVKDIVTEIYRKNPNTGFTEKVHFVGSLRLKPKGWKIGKTIK